MDHKKQDQGTETIGERRAVLIKKLKSEHERQERCLDVLHFIPYSGGLQTLDISLKKSRLYLNEIFCLNKLKAELIKNLGEEPGYE